MISHEAETRAESAPETERVADRLASTSVYRPYLDGLRAVAVYLVVLFHAGIAGVSSGYIGVDVFFVLSGFLVTQLLLRDLAGGGAIRFARFYARRFRRLLPAAAVTLIVTAAVFAAVTPSKALESLDAFQAAFLYSANWYFIRQSTDYFASGVDTSPVLQFWSLAVEEQFYVLWPLVLGGIFWMADRLRRRQLLFVRATVAGGAILSMLWALHLRTGDPNRAYFGTDARAYQLLAGALIALFPDLVRSFGRFRRLPRIAVPVALALLLLLATSIWDADAIVRGMAVAAVAAIAIVALECADGGLVKRALSSGPVVYLGKISYGTYLWHWPLILLADEVLELTPTAMAWSACLVATALASLSFQVLEWPIHASKLIDRHKIAVIGAGLAISVIAALVVIPAITDPGEVSAAPPSSGTNGFTPVPSWYDSGRVYFDGFGAPVKGRELRTVSCVDKAPEQCTVVHGSGPHVLLMGDSNGLMMVPALTKAAQDNDLTLSLEVDPGCPWQRGLYVLSDAIRQRCKSQKEDAYRRVIPALDPDVVVVINSGDSLQLTPEVRTATAESLQELTTGGRKVVVIEANPAAPLGTNPRTCLETAKWLEDCRYLADPAPSPMERFTRTQAAASDQVWSANFDKIVCPYLPICDPIVGGEVVKWDRQHLATRFSRSIAPSVAAYLRDNGLIPR